MFYVLRHLGTRERLIANLFIIGIWFFVAWETLNVFVLQRIPPVRILDIAVVKKDVAQDGAVKVHAIIDRLRECSATVSQIFIDSGGVRHDLPRVNIQLKPGPSDITRAIALPADMPMGPAKLITSTDYDCHWSHKFWPLERAPRSLSFEVVAAKKTAQSPAVILVPAPVAEPQEAAPAKRIDPELPLAPQLKKR